MRRSVAICMLCAMVMACAGAAYAGGKAPGENFHLGFWFNSLGLAAFAMMAGFLFLLEKTDPHAVVSELKGTLITMSVVAFLVATFVLASLERQAGAKALGAGCLLSAVVFVCCSVAQHDKGKRAWLSGLVFVAVMIYMMARGLPSLK